MRQISLPNCPEKNSYTLRHAFLGNYSKQLQPHDSVHLSSVYTDYSFHSCKLSNHRLVLIMPAEILLKIRQLRGGLFSHLNAFVLPGKTQNIELASFHSVLYYCFARLQSLLDFFNLVDSRLILRLRFFGSELWAVRSHTSEEYSLEFRYAAEVGLCCARRYMDQVNAA